ncbi:MAG: hypothetical protein GC136_03020 [Alphaproteobacteria bacterium]|nr:hypothetical protein [Alphaproteobacteria bacterium]
MKCPFQSLFSSENKKQKQGRVAEIGWAITDDKASLIWDDPTPYRRDDPKPASAKSVQLCPAAIDFDARHFVVPCPIDVTLRLGKDDKGNPVLMNPEGAKSTIRPKHLGQMAVLINRVEWRHPDRPIVQFITPYVFMADEPVYINQLPPYLDYAREALPGAMIAGRFPAHIWPRPLMWAFEWFDTSRDIVLQKGKPWFYVRFEAEDPSRNVRLVESEITPEVKRYIDSVSGVTNYVNRTYSLFPRAEKRRPAKLVVPRK